VLNGTDRDAVVKLLDLTLRPPARRVVYIQAQGEATIARVGPGTYEVRFGLGTHWDGEAFRFARARAHFRFVEPVVFTETLTAGGVDVVKHKITLHRVSGGNAQAESLDESTFDLE
jgi:hypothetical protein